MRDTRIVSKLARTELEALEKAQTDPDVRQAYLGEYPGQYPGC